MVYTNGNYVTLQPNFAYEIQTYLIETEWRIVDGK